MIQLHTDKKHTPARRVTWMILLFVFCMAPLAGQADTLKQEAPSISIDETGQVDPDRRSVDEMQIDPLPLGVAADPQDKRRNTARGGDTLIIENNSSIANLSNDTTMEHSPRKAMLFSLVLPGAGQVYNKKIWKVPIVYGVLAGAGYWVYYNTGNYREASANYAFEQSELNERYLRFWRRNLEISIITVAAAHGLQVLDAYVDAYLFYWDVNPDLAIRVAPSFDPIVLPTGMVAGNYGLTLSMKFK